MTRGALALMLAACSPDSAGGAVARSPLLITTTADFAQGGNDEGDVELQNGTLRRERPAATLGTWSAAGTMTAPRRNFGAAAAAGRLYVSGGCTSATDFITCGGGFTASVEMTRISSGAAGAWTPLTPLPAAMLGHAMVAVNGALYVIGGQTAQGPSRDVWFARLAADGTPGAWQQTASLVAPRFSLAVAAWQGRLYATGGSGGPTSLLSTEVAELNADGTLKPWVMSSPFAPGRQVHQAIARGGWLYVLGGTGTVTLDSVVAAPILPDGSLGAFADQPALQTGVTWFAAVAARSHVFVLGGSNGATQVATTYAAPLLEGGGESGFTAGLPLPAPRQLHRAVVSDGFVYVLGGGTAGAPVLGDVISAPLLESSLATGAPGPWRPVTPLPLGLTHLGASGHGGRVYVTGGCDAGDANGNCGSISDAVFIGAVLPDAGIDAWLPAAPLPAPRWRHVSVVVGGTLMLVGGASDASVLDDVVGAGFLPDGGLSAWRRVGTLPGGMSGHAAGTDGRLVFAAGGLANVTAAAPVLADGGLGAFLSGPTMSFVRYESTGAVRAGRVRVFGGWSGVPDDTVEEAPVGALGQLGPFTVRSDRLTVARSTHAIAQVNEWIYNAGGGNTVDRARWLPDGGLSRWSSSGSSAGARLALAAVGPDLYALGGPGTEGPRVETARVAVHEPVGRWSQLVDLQGVTPMLRALVVRGGPGSGAVRVAYRTAGLTASFGPRVELGEVPLDTMVPLSGSQVRWVWLSLELEDVEPELFQRDVTELELTMDPVIAPPDAGPGDGGATEGDGGTLEPRALQAGCGCGSVPAPLLLLWLIALRGTLSASRGRSRCSASPSRPSAARRS